jgi:hypothetical protein
VDRYINPWRRPGILYKLPPKFPLADFILVRDDGDNSPSSKKLQLFSFSFEVYDRRHQFSTIVEESSSSPEFYGNIPQKLYKAAFGELPPTTADSKALPNTTFFFCTHNQKIALRVRFRTLIVIPCAWCGNLLPSIMDNLFRDLVMKNVDYSNKKTQNKLMNCSVISFFVIVAPPKNQGDTKRKTPQTRPA